jgi:CSLREA domain-containing protein
MAADFRVTTTLDDDDKECLQDCTLREAVVLAGSADRVLVPSGTYLLTAGELSLNNDTIIGEDARKTIIDGDRKSRVLRVIEVQSRVSGVTIRNGNGVGVDPDGIGGGIFVHSGSLILQNSTVSGNTGTMGAGIAASGSGIAALNGVTVSGNTASTGRLTRGGGIAADGSGGLILQNSTVSGNTAVDEVGAASQGGGVYSSGQLAIIASTIASNSADEGGGLYAVPPQSGTFSMSSSLISHGAGGACGGSADSLTATANVISDATCQFKDPSNLQSVNPQIGTLADNGGPTNTHALQPTSPAIGRAASCLALDQRGFTRVAPCDSGAYEYRAPTLSVVTQVVNDSGGNLDPSRFTVHVRGAAGGDVSGSPQPGDERGTVYTLAPGNYAVAADTVAGYTLTVSGDCATGGAITLAEGQNRTCTITATDDVPPVQAQSSQQQQLPPPDPGKTVNALPKSGMVKVKLPGTASFVNLDEARQLPVGTVVDATKGHVTLVAAANGSGGTATAEFWAGIFKLGQTRGKAPTTTLTLVEKLRCPRSGKASMAAKRKKKRRLWGDGSGKFRTKGKHSAATVVGTRWLVEDTCKSTLTRVVRGRVSVRDFVKKKTVIVRAGKKYVAKAKR